jgi:hypothetical protein
VRRHGALLVLFGSLASYLFFYSNPAMMGALAAGYLARVAISYIPKDNP